MSIDIEKINKIGHELRKKGTSHPLSLATHRVVDKNGDVVFNGDNLADSLEKLIAAGVAGDLTALNEIITAADLTSSGVLTTLATNVGAHGTQGATLATALVMAMTAANAVTLKSLVDTVQAVTPLTGDTVTAAVSSVNETAYLTPAGTLAALTYVFPSNANSRIGQVIRLVSTQAVTALTVSAAGLTLEGAAVTALTANVPVSWQKVAASTWIRLN